MRTVNNKGVTLTELMISVAILGILISVGGTFLVGGVKFYRLTTAKGEIQRDARRSIDLISRNLRQGRASTVLITRYENQPPCSLLQFSHISGTDYRFYQRDGALYMGLRATGTTDWSDRKIADNLRTLFFTYPCTNDTARVDNTAIISVSLCFEKSTYQGSSKTLQLSVEKVRIMN
jgi:prepilin-type N-terminal cleavage/methylation domain-containing protein